MRVVYILEMSPLFIICSLNIFCHSVTCLFSLTGVSDEKKFLILMSFKSLVIYFMIGFFVSCLRKILLYSKQMKIFPSFLKLNWFFFHIRTYSLTGINFSV